MNKMKKLILLATLFAMLLMVGCSEDAPEVSEQAPEKLDTSEAIAVINEELVSVNAFDILYKVHETAYIQSGAEQYLDQVYDGMTLRDAIKYDVLNILVENTLIRQYVAETGFTVDEQEVKTTLEELQTLMDQSPDSEEFYESVGITEEYWKDEIKTSLIREEFTRIITDQIEKDQERLQEMYKEFTVNVKASHILVSEEALASEIKSRIEAGEAFEDLVAEYSEDVGSVSDGGSLGYFSRGTMPAEFDQVVFSMGVGEISNPVETQYGFHIIKVEDTQTIEQMIESGEDEEKINEFKETVKSLLFTEHYSEILEELKTNATMETFMEKVLTKTEE